MMDPNPSKMAADHQTTTFYPVTDHSSSSMQQFSDDNNDSYRGGDGSSVIQNHLESGAEVESSPPATNKNNKSSSSSSSRYKGVIPQPNGRWGAQIYQKQQRFWLGTFDTEAQAAAAYGVGALKFRVPNPAACHLNFNSNKRKTTYEEEAQNAFLDSHSREEIVDMLRNHTYHQELEHTTRKILVARNVVVGHSPHGRHAELLFEKVLTPSDVGRLNRLVIPKHHAEKSFRPFLGVLMNVEEVVEDGRLGKGKVWRFRYSFWRSSQSYVLMRGWGKFVKEKKLTAGDSVRFSRSTSPDRQLFIDWKKGSKRMVEEPSGRLASRGAAGDQVVIRLFGVDVFPGKKKAPVDGFSRSENQRID